MDIPDHAIRKGLENPRKAWKYIANRLFSDKNLYLACRSINQKYNRRFREPGDHNIMEGDWDTLFLIDACRYDFFAEESNLPGTLDDRLSPGSMSQEFIHQTFSDQQYHDTVYVTANPFVVEIESGTFYDIVSLVDDYFSNKARTVPPEDVTAAVRKAHEKYPHKRIIAHYMQPHAPFLSDFGQMVTGELNWRGNQYHLSQTINIFDLKQAYRENVIIILEELDKIIPDIDGKIVVTSDHGELLGERLFPIPIRGFEHPKSIYKDELLRVPWLVMESETRRDIREELPKKRMLMAPETAEKRLKQLGYL